MEHPKNPLTTSESGAKEAQGRFEKLSKGSLIDCPVVTMRNREGAEYIELKARFMQVHSKSKGGGGGGNPAPKSNAVGMDDSISLATTCPSPDTNGILSDDYRYADSDKNSSTQSNDIYWKPSKLEAGSKAEIRMLGGENAFRDGASSLDTSTSPVMAKPPTYPSKWRENAGLAYQYELSPEAKEDKYKEIAAMPKRSR